MDYCDELRASLAIPGYGPMVRQVSFQKTLHLLGALNTRIVILEDFHQTYNFKKHQMVAYQNFVHPLISKYDIRVVLTGVPQIWRWAMDDEQTLGRSIHLQYRAWAPSDDDFIEFLEGFEQWCPVQKGSALSSDQKLRKAIVRKTHGVCREVMRELIGLDIYAVATGRERLDFETWLAFRDRDLN
ncbi:TniB family NTP-binding protein [Yoonia sp. 2307UL14-13]|uniref:TniB family NTP-binding protein n=1 Tax=Yoonia sp. 2307UL14-13 TaxID=3126506 RepID=UPI0030B32C1A